MVRRDQALGPRWQHRLPVARALLGGVLAGLVAGLVMVVPMVHSGLEGTGLWLPPKLVAATWYGRTALLGDGGVVLVGLLTHFAVSALYGALFGLTFGRLSSTRITVSVGVVYGVLVWAIMTLAVLPWGNGILAARVALSPWGWLAYHVLFGALVGASPVFARAFGEPTDRPYVTEPAEVPI